MDEINLLIIFRVFFAENYFDIREKMEKFDEKRFFIKKVKNHFLSKNYD
jgi:hypothetical protein